MKHQPPKPFKPSNLQTYPIKVLKDKKQEVLDQYERLLKMGQSEARDTKTKMESRQLFNKGLEKDKTKLNRIIGQLNESIKILESINNHKF